MVLVKEEELWMTEKKEILVRIDMYREIHRVKVHVLYNDLFNKCTASY